MRVIRTGRSLERRATFLAATAAACLLLPVPPAAASCAEDAGPDGAPVIFVGTAEEERRGYTRFAVEEVWAGPDLAEAVWVRSGQDQPPWPLSMLSAVSSSGDADFLTGERYVVGASRSFGTGACSVAEADGARPRSGPDVREPVAGAETGADPPSGPAEQAAWVVGSVGVVAMSLTLLRRLRRRRAATEAH